MLEAQVVEVVVGVVEAEDGEILSGLEDAGDGDTRGGSVVQRGCCGAAGEALDMHVPARVEDLEWFEGQLNLDLKPPRQESLPDGSTPER